MINKAKASRLLAKRAGKTLFPAIYDTHTLFAKELLESMPSTLIYRHGESVDGHARILDEKNLLACPVKWACSDGFSEASTMCKYGMVAGFQTVLACTNIPPYMFDPNIEMVIRQNAQMPEVSAVVFNSKLLDKVYGIKQTPKAFIPYMVRPFWRGVRDQKKIVTIFTLNNSYLGKFNYSLIAAIQHSRTTDIVTEYNFSSHRSLHEMRARLLQSSIVVNCSERDADMLIYVIAASMGCPVLSVENKFYSEAFGGVAEIVESYTDVCRYDTGKLRDVARKQQEYMQDMYVRQYKAVVESWENVCVD